MKLFSCTSCHEVVFFENSQCTRCGHALLYVPEHGVVTALDVIGEVDFLEKKVVKYRALDPKTERAEYRMCQNGVEWAACNWAVRADTEDAYCRSCKLNSVVPNLNDASALAAWQRLEIAKRRLLYTLFGLGLPTQSKAEDSERGLAFAFKQDEPDQKVLTGHADGLITINIAEADDPVRERTRIQMGEAYRTLLGHFRHEVGHYYWDRLVKNTDWYPKFRELFGDESQDYAGACERHYASGPPVDWQSNYVSAYATMHAWEDFAETWAHYLHMVDTLQTARAYGLALRAKPVGGTKRPLTMTATRLDFDDFDDLLSAWVPLTVAMNSLNRSMGLPDPYPFVLSLPAIEKLRFVHDVVEAAG